VGTTGCAGLILGTTVFWGAFGLAINVRFVLRRLDLVARTWFFVLGFRLNGLTLRLVDTWQVYANHTGLSKLREVFKTGRVCYVSAA